MPTNPQSTDSPAPAQVDPRNKYVGTEVKWIHAQHINGGDWKVRYVNIGESCPNLEDSRMMDETQIGEMRQSEFAIFRNLENWFDKRPRRYLDLRDKKDRPISSALSGFVNSFDSSWF